MLYADFTDFLCKIPVGDSINPDSSDIVGSDDKDACEDESGDTDDDGNSDDE